MPRAHLRQPIANQAGDAVQNAAVWVYLPGTVTPVVVYDASAGGNTITLPLISNNQGEVECWLAYGQTVDLYVTDQSGAAYLADTPTTLVTFAGFVERAEVMPSPEAIGQTVLSIAKAGAVTTGLGTKRLYVPFAFTVTAVTAQIQTTAPSVTAVTIDVNRNGTTLFAAPGDRPVVGVGTFVSAEMPVPNVAMTANVDYFTVDIDQGDIAAAMDLLVLIRGRLT